MIETFRYLDIYRHFDFCYHLHQFMVLLQSSFQKEDLSSFNEVSTKKLHVSLQLTIASRTVIKLISI